MGNWCLTKDRSDEFRKALTDGRINPEKLIGMNSDERREFFGKIVGDENAKEVNASFESKLLLKNAQQGLQNWAKQTLGDQKIKVRDTPEIDQILGAKNETDFKADLAERKLKVPVTFEQAQKYTQAMQSLYRLRNTDSESRTAELAKIVGEDRAAEANLAYEQAFDSSSPIQGLREMAKEIAGIEPPPSAPSAPISQIERLHNSLRAGSFESYKRDLAAQKLGFGVSFEEAQRITDMTGRLRELGQQRDAWGNPTPEYFDQLRKTSNFVKSLNPSSFYSRFIDSARLLKLLSLKTPIKVAAETGINRGIEEGVSSLTFARMRGPNPEEARAYAKNANKIAFKTGFIPSLMNSLDEGNVFGDAIDRTHFQGPGLVRTVQRGIDNVAIHWEHLYTFASQANGAFASFVNKEAGRVARQEGYRGPELKDRANELMKESMKIGTTDPIASQIRAAGQQHAMRVTNTNTTFASTFGVGTKNLINKMIPGAKLGDLFIAFAKIPSNVVANGIDYAGGSFVNAAVEGVKQIRDIRDGEKFNYVPATRALIRGFGGVGASALIAAFIQKDDFDEKTGMIRVRFGSHASPWISTELLGPLGPGVRGMLDAKFAKPGENALYKYFAGVGEGILNMPGLREIREFSDYGAGKLAAGAATGLVPAIAADAYKSYEAGNVAPLIAGAKVKTDAQMRTQKYGTADEKEQANMDYIKVHNARLNNALDTAETLNRQGRFTDAEKDALKKKLDSKDDKGGLTNEQVDRANALLSLSGEKAYKPDPNAKDLSLPEYNKNADGVFEKVAAWAEGLATDPVDAWNKWSLGRRIARLENGTIIVERISQQESSKYKAQLGATKGKTQDGVEVTLDDKIPYELGGDGSKENLQLIPKAEAEFDDKVENALGGALHQGKVTGHEARKLILDYKEHRIGTEEINKAIGSSLPPRPTSFAESGSGGSRSSRGLSLPGLRLPGLKGLK